ncbi:hypothetical protein [Streptomyces sp. NBC_01212]|uniref:hypothetical protein n=1 Tax=Streptomyces sp. NBC_01212 TaxID=2903775 RepID=UPI002E16469C|nr:hypothetical protein OG722_05080 [Streptomyces sp. NBC_01212]
MFAMNFTVHTANGSTVTIRRRGIEFDLETRNARGETISTVVMNEADVKALLTSAGVHINAFDDAYDRGYRDGRRDGDAA